MKKHSAGILLYRLTNTQPEVLLVHPGGPFWAKKDQNAWSIPKGELDDAEELLPAAKREFIEEIGAAPPDGTYIHLGQAKQSSGKVVHAFALESDFNLENFKSNVFAMEWPPKSGRQQEFPENDKAMWVSIGLAKEKLVKGQLPLLETLARRLNINLQDLPPETPDPDPQARLF
ncbi:MAG TPA: NUDIX domain-containing protein [Bacillota bacterium]|nr:NUDIX domain-containing protein [Bacillota bacterium]